MTKIRNASVKQGEKCYFVIGVNNKQYETVSINTIIGKMTFNNIDYKYAFYLKYSILVFKLIVTYRSFFSS